MNAFARLQELARRASDDPDAALDRVLALACELLRMDLAVLGTVVGDEHVVERAVGADGRRDTSLDGTWPAEGSFAAHVRGDAVLLVADTAAAPEAIRRTCRRRGCSYAGVRLGVDRRGAGASTVLGLARAAPHDDLGEWEAELLAALAPVVAELWTAVLARAAQDAGGAGDADGPLPEGGAAAARLVGADDLAGLTRPLLDALHELSGIATTFLCRVDQETDVLDVLLVHRTGSGPDVVEGAALSWSGSMCHRARAEGVEVVTDASARWPDSGAGVDLGLRTHATVPVELSDGTLWGTLCASDVAVHEHAGDHVAALRLFARLIGAEVERTAALAAERLAAAETLRRSRTDELTGASTRAAVRPWLAAALERVGPGERVVLSFVDVDRFKSVNDGHGHAAGDAVLVELVSRLRAGARDGDLVARLGGDEVVVAALLPRRALDAFEDRVAQACAFDLALPGGQEVTVCCSVGFVTSDEAGAADIVAVADARMYHHKRQVRAGDVPALGRHLPVAAPAPL